MNEIGYEEPEVAPTYDISNKNAWYLAALKNLGITKNSIEEMTEFDTAPCPPDKFYSNWEQYQGNNQFDLKPENDIKLQKIYTRGRVKKENYSREGI